LVAGPIERPQNLLHQFKEEHRFNYNRVTSGLRLMAWGLFKKVVIADRLSLVVDNVYDNVYTHNSFSLLLATLFFTFQIYCDFSGYSDMAIGAARIMGFDLMKNFNMPYFSKSVSEFWKRWHISLSTWFKDYLYISLGGNRVAIPRMYLNLFIVFLVSGLWHGANWTYIVWGALHGFYLVFALMTKNLRSKLNRVVGLERIKFLPTLITFSLVAIAWVFFRAQTVNEAVYIIRQIATGMPAMIQKLLHHQSIFEYVGVTTIDLAYSFFFILFLLTIEWLQNQYNIYQKIMRLPLMLRWSLYYSVSIVIIQLGVFEDRQFIYFQF
jgi:alginate O-acetyltransferase complex protein AlgI